MRPPSSLPTTPPEAQHSSTGTPPGTSGLPAVSPNADEISRLTALDLSRQDHDALPLMLPELVSILLDRLSAADRSTNYPDPLRISDALHAQALRVLPGWLESRLLLMRPPGPKRILASVKMMCDLLDLPLPDANRMELYDVGLQPIPAALLRLATKRLVQTWRYAKLPLPADYLAAVSDEIKMVQSQALRLQHFLRRLQDAQTFPTSKPKD